MTPEVEAVLIDALKKGNTRRAACAAAGISEDSLARYQANSADFADSLIRAEHQAEQGYTNIIQLAAQGGDWKAAAWWLERRRKQDYSSRQEVEHSGGLKVERKAEDFHDDELATIAAGSG